MLATSAERDLLKLPRRIQDQIEPVIDALSHAPRPRGVKKLRGESGLWRARVGTYRILYRIDDRQRIVDITHIRHRAEAYR